MANWISSQLKFRAPKVTTKKMKSLVIDQYKMMYLLENLYPEYINNSIQ